MAVKVLFVCLGNICRSPAAEAVFLHLAASAGVGDRFTVDSAGTGAWHVGQRADRRLHEAAGTRGITVTSRARQVVAGDFTHFDYIFAMDADNLQALRSQAPRQYRHKIRLFRDHDPDAPGADVPDPYYGTVDDFHDVLDIVTRTGQALLVELVAEQDG
jgi:protein-tyrosine phosphatase